MVQDATSDSMEQSPIPWYRRHVDVDIIASLFCLLGVCLLVASGVGLPDYSVSVPLLWTGIFHVLLAYGLFRYLPWARWATLIEITFFSTLLVFMNIHEAMRYGLVDIGTTLYLLIYLPLLLVFISLTRRPVAAAFRHRVGTRPLVVKITGGLIALLSIASIAGGLFHWILFMVDPGVYPGYPSPLYDNPFFNFVMPAGVLLMSGAGLLGLESWSRRWGSALIAMVLPYLILFYWNLNAAINIPVYAVMALILAILLTVIQRRPEVDQAYALPVDGDGGER